MPQFIEGDGVQLRRRLIRTVTATVAILATVVVVPARPATAVDPVTVTQVIAAVQKGYDLWKSFKGGGGDLEQATAQILAAIDAAKNEIIAHTDELAAAEARACTTQAVIELADVSAMSQTALTAWAQEVTGCVTLIDSLLTAVVSRPTLDRLGFALNAVGPIALAARARAGLSTAGLQALLIGSNQVVVTKVAPVCVFEARRILAHLLYSWGCTAADGTVVSDQALLPRSAQAPNPNLQALADQVGARTSWRLAREILPALRA